MNKRGEGYVYEVLIAFFILILAFMFFVGDQMEVLPPVFLMIGAVLSLWGMVERNVIGLSGGIMLIAIALLFQEVLI